MLNENPTWWHVSDRKRVFLNRFAVIHPGCCDGKRPASKAVTPSMVASVTTKTQNKPVSKRQSKKSAKDTGNFLVGIIVIVIILYFLFRQGQIPLSSGVTPFSSRRSTKIIQTPYRPLLDSKKTCQGQTSYK
jgi:hypothetical protein